MYTPPQRNMLYEDVIKQILSLIKTGKWMIGEKIPSENELAKHFQVSRNSIREALKVLVHLKIIDSKAGRGTYVLEESVQNMQGLEFIDTLREDSSYESLMETRIIIEPELAYRAALYATEEEIDNLESKVETSFKALATQDYSTPTIGFPFHREIAKISKNIIIQKFLQSIVIELISLRDKIMEQHTEADLQREIDEHKMVFNFIKNQQPEEAKKAMYQHLKNAEHSLRGDVKK